MAVGSKSFPQQLPAQTEISSAEPNCGPVPHHAFGLGPASQVTIAYLLLLASLWSSMATSRAWLVLCGGILLSLTLASGYSRRVLGLDLPSRQGAVRVLLFGLLAVTAILGAGIFLAGKLPVNSDWPPARALWQYSIWAMVQQFLLQSFFYVRLETVMEARSAVFATAALFAAAHVPNPILTMGTLIVGLFFCEMFRRYRSIYPLGIVHAALGLSLAETIPDRWLHHMRVGIGYLHFHLH
jgi:CAAX prenyl protease-like protein